MKHFSLFFVLCILSLILFAFLVLLSPEASIVICIAHRFVLYYCLNDVDYKTFVEN